MVDFTKTNKYKKNWTTPLKKPITQKKKTKKILLGLENHEMKAIEV